MTALLQITNVAKKGEGDFHLSDITLLQGRLEKVAIAGETGAGKSTVLKLIAGLAQPDQGEILFEGKKVIGPDEQLVPGHPGIAYLSQHFELQKSLRVEQVLAYANALTDRAANQLYRVCQIDHLLKRRTDQLSGGEKQRVAICRLLISAPRLLLLDEPFSHLDMVHKNTLKEVIRDIGKKLKITCMLVSHDPLDTLSWADKIVVMRNGRIVQTDTPEMIYQQPVDAYAGGLFGKYSFIARKDARPLMKLKALKTFFQKKPEKALFLRPEQFKIVRKNDRAVRGKAEATRFYGGYNEIDIRIGEELITVRSNDRNIREGNIVYVSLASKNLWAL